MTLADPPPYYGIFHNSFLTLSFPKMHLNFVEKLAFIINTDPNHLSLRVLRLVEDSGTFMGAKTPPSVFFEARTSVISVNNQLPSGRLLMG